MSGRYWPAMDSIESYETFDEYWRDVVDIFADAPFRQSRKSRNVWRNELAVTVSGGLAIKLVAPACIPTSLQIRQATSRGNIVTKLDVSQRYTEDSYIGSYIGHLLVTPDDHSKAHGRPVDVITDIPRKNCTTINQGIQMLDKVYNHWLSKAALELLT